MPSFLNIGLRKVGGIWFWNVGRIGGSFHISSRATFARKQFHSAAQHTELSIAYVMSVDI